MFTVVLDTPGGPVAEITPETESVQFDTAAVGGFGSCSFTLPGFARGVVKHLTKVTLRHGAVLLWEGRLEDITYNMSGGSWTTQVQAFGWRSLLDATSVRRIWSKRDIAWQPIPGGNGVVLRSSTTKDDKGTNVTTGQFDPADSTKLGVQLAGNGVAVANLAGNGVTYTLPSGLTLTRIMGTFAQAGTHVGVSSMAPEIADSTDGSGFSDRADLTAGSFNVALAAGTKIIRLLWFNNSGGSLTPTSADLGQWYDIRILGSTVTEDATGGFFGSTLLADLITLVPGLAAGVIEQGSDYTIQSLDRSTRDSATSVVEEIASYYAREWAVWENAQFDWRTPNLDEPQYVLQVADCIELEITSSVDTLVKTSYVLYTDAGSGLDAEASAVSSSQRNPFVRTSAVKDGIQKPGFPMTANTAAQLAQLAGTVNGSYPPVTGRIVLNATKLVTNLVGSRVPAFEIRAGCNIYIPDLPRDESLLPGRDGQTLFHVVTTDTNMDARTVTLELEGQGRQLDVVLARLAASTRVLTG